MVPTVQAAAALPVLVAMALPPRSAAASAIMVSSLAVIGGAGGLAQLYGGTGGNGGNGLYATGSVTFDNSGILIGGAGGMGNTPQSAPPGGGQDGLGGNGGAGALI